MKRSEINNEIRGAVEFFDKMNFKLPEFAHFSVDKMMEIEKKGIAGEIFAAGMGWDLTDFGLGNFDKTGLLLFTLRNGKVNSSYTKPYAEKIMITKENQLTPLHFHWSKQEDIINRGGGNLIIEVFNSDKNEGLSDTVVKVSIDGIKYEFKPGGKIILKPGQSICLTSGMYHRFYGEAGKGSVLVGEVSMVNDDTKDNRFYEPLGRFSEIEEDENPFRVLVQDYQNYSIPKAK